MVRKKVKIIGLLLCFFWIQLACAQVQVGAGRLGMYLPILKNQKVALCGNQTSIVGQTHLVDTLLSEGVNLVKLFCPEHGFRGNAEAGAVISSSQDAKTGLPIISLYGKNKKPTAEQMQDVDVILFDLQDVGCRFYTYISTLHYVMEAAAENHVKVIVLDRPNPNGYFIDGPVLNSSYRSFVGMHPVPVVYGMTIGEYARMINGEKWLANGVQCDLMVVLLDGYTHDTRYNLPVSPSPNLQTPESIYLYPSLCFFEGTQVSVGRGTSMPFQIFGFPNMKSGDYVFTPVPIKGVSENPPFKNMECSGFNLTQMATDSLSGANSVNPDYLLIAYKDYEDKSDFFINASFFDKLAGTDQFRKDIVAGKNAKEIRDSWQEGLEHFKTIRDKYLLYP